MKQNHGNLTLFALLLLVSLAKGDTAQSLLDAQNSLPDSAFEWDKLLPFIYGLGFFIMGIITARFTLIEKLIKEIKERVSTR